MGALLGVGTKWEHIWEQIIYKLILINHAICFKLKALEVKKKYSLIPL